MNGCQTCNIHNQDTTNDDDIIENDFAATNIPKTVSYIILKLKIFKHPFRLLKNNIMKLENANMH